MKLTDKINFFSARVMNPLLVNGIETYADLMNLYHKSGYTGIFALHGMPHIAGNALADIENVVNAFLAAEQKEKQTDSSTLSFQDYINNLKLFADNAGASAIENEVVTDDGYKITIKIQKTK